MLRRPARRRRPAFSLVEVLVAMFIVAAGLIALMSLFPVGAVQMGKALRDSRSQNTCVQADARFREIYRQQVLEKLPTDPYYLALEDAGGALPSVATSRQASYPVLFDPIGWQTYPAGSPKQLSVAGNNLIPRRTATVPATPPVATLLDPRQSVRLSTLPDDLEFAADGTPANGEVRAVRESLTDPTVDPTIFAQHRFTWGVALQRPDNGVKAVCDLKVLVFDRRAAGVNVADNELVRVGAAAPTGSPVNTVPNQIRAGDTQLAFAENNDVLGFRVGSWILDGTITAPPPGGTGFRNMNFYRVTSVAEVGSPPTQTVVELHVPIAKPRGDVADPTVSYPPTLYLFRELIDVYDRPQLAPSGYRKQTP